MRLPSLAGLLLLAASTPASERIPGPIPAELIRVVDGDTLLVTARVWPGHRVDTRVRLLGIDAPELRSLCAEEREQARAARDWLRQASEAESSFFGTCTTTSTVGACWPASRTMPAKISAAPC